MKTMFITFYPEATIKPVEVVKETKHTLVLPMGMTIRKADQFPMVYHPSWDDAQAHLVNEAEKDLELFRRGVEIREKRSDQFKGLKPQATGN